MIQGGIVTFKSNMHYMLGLAVHTESLCRTFRGVSNILATSNKTYCVVIQVVIQMSYSNYYTSITALIIQHFNN